MTSENRTTPSRETIDPRVERSRQVILQAALDELGEVGYGMFRIESVAARAGVGKSTIYRHWTDRLALIADAFETFHVQMVPNTDTAPPREKVHSLVRHVAQVFVDSTFSVCIPALIEGAERDQRLRNFHHKYSAERRQGLAVPICPGARLSRFEPDGIRGRSVRARLSLVRLAGAPLDRLLIGRSLARVGPGQTAFWHD